MGPRLRETRRTLTVLGMAFLALLGFVPFLLNLLASLLGGRGFRRRVRSLMEEGSSVPVGEPPDAPVRPVRKVYLLAGEDSGDLHAAGLVSALRRMAPEVEVRAMGGPRMEAAGARLDHDLVRMNVMGVLPVLRAAGTFLGLFRSFLRRLEEDPPDVLVPVDYPGFNVRAARAARRRGVKVVYYIAPQIWAWAPWRVRRIGRAVDRMLAILPFERDLYARRGVPCAFVGHPLFEHLEATCPAAERTDRPPRTVGLLPGSRRSEVRGLLPSMLRAARRLHERRPDLSFVVPSAGARVEEEIRRIAAREGDGLPLRIAAGRTHEEMREMDLALVASGTASLELLYYRVPMVVMYRVGRVGRLFMRLVLVTPHVALANIVAGKRIVPELVGPGDLSGRASEELLGLLEDADRNRASREALEAARSRLLFGGVAQRAAEWVLRG